MTLGFIRASIVAASAMAATYASAQSIAAPDLALTFDREQRTLHRIVGTPGAAIMRPVPGHVAAAVPANARTPFALVVTEERGDVAILDPSSSEPLRIITGVSSRPAAMALSPRGTTAALLYSDKRLLQVITGLPDTPSIAGELSLPAGAVELFAISNSADVLLAATQEDGSALIYAGGPERSWIPFTAVGKIGGLAFANSGTAAAIADTARAAVYIVNDIHAGTAAVLTEAHGIVAPAHVAFSGDASLLVVTNAASGVATIVNLKAQTTASMDCECSPVLLQPAGDALFLLGSVTDGPMPVVDARGTRPRVLFIPPKREF
jgi:hypothetical protein